MPVSVLRVKLLGSDTQIRRWAAPMAKVQQVSALSLLIGLPYGHQGSRQDEPKPSLFIQQHQSRAYQSNLKAISCVCSISCISGGTPDVSFRDRPCPGDGPWQGHCKGHFVSGQVSPQMGWSWRHRIKTPVLRRGTHLLSLMSQLNESLMK